MSQSACLLVHGRIVCPASLVRTDSHFFHHSIAKKRRFLPMDTQTKTSVRICCMGYLFCVCVLLLGNWTERPHPLFKVHLCHKTVLLVGRISVVLTTDLGLEVHKAKVSKTFVSSVRCVLCQRALQSDIAPSTSRRHYHFLPLMDIV